MYAAVSRAGPLLVPGRCLRALVATGTSALYAFQAGAVGQCTGNITLAHADGVGDDHILVLGYPVASGQILSAHLILKQEVVSGRWGTPYHLSKATEGKRRAQKDIDSTVTRVLISAHGLDDHRLAKTVKATW